MGRTVVKIQQGGQNWFVSIPKALVEKLKADYMTVGLDEAGRLIYTPVPEGI